MHIISILIYLSLFSCWVNGWAMHPECHEIENELKAGMTVAFRQAENAVLELKKNPREKHVDALAKIVFGGDDVKIANAIQRFENVYSLHNILPSIQRPPIGEVLIYCTTDHYKKVVRTGQYWDTDLDIEMPDAALVEACKDGTPLNGVYVMAFTRNKGSAKNGPEERHDILQLCPWYLKKLARPPPQFLFTEDLVRKTADVKSKNVLGKIFSKRNKESATPVDSLALFEHTLLHELTHTSKGGYSDDTPENKCYGWMNVAKCQRNDNADNLAFFGLGVDLILNYKYTVNKDGTLQKIT